MITKIIDDESTSIIPEEADDLLTLRRIIKRGDRIVGDTTRVIKQDKEFRRPDKGERVKIRIKIEVEKISLDDILDRLKVTGVIVESNNESVPHGSHHSFYIKINEGFKLIKKNWSNIEKNLIKGTDENIGFLLIAIDTEQSGIGRLKGTHLEILPNIYSGASGKRYKTKFNLEKYFEQIHIGLVNNLRNKEEIIIFGPGETKKKFGNFLNNKGITRNHSIKIIEGIDSAGEDGIHTFTKSQGMKEIIGESKLGKVSKILDEIMLRAYNKSKKFTMGFIETKKANNYGAIDALVFSEKVIQTENEEEIIEFLNQVESKGAKAYSVDTSTDIGLRVSGLGGIISLLRFPVEN